MLSNNIILLLDIFFLKSFNANICFVEITGVPKANDSKTQLGRPSYLEGKMK